MFKWGFLCIVSLGMVRTADADLFIDFLDLRTHTGNIMGFAILNADQTLTAPGGEVLTNTNGFLDSNFLDFHDEVVGTWTLDDDGTIYTFDLSTFPESTFPVVAITAPPTGATAVSGVAVNFSSSTSRGSITGAAVFAGGQMTVDLSSHPAQVTYNLNSGVNSAPVDNYFDGTVSDDSFLSGTAGIPASLIPTIDWQGRSNKVTLNIVTIPEPSSFLAMCIVLPIGICFRRFTSRNCSADN